MVAELWCQQSKNAPKCIFLAPERSKMGQMGRWIGRCTFKTWDTSMKLDLKSTSAIIVELLCLQNKNAPKMHILGPWIVRNGQNRPINRHLRPETLPTNLVWCRSMEWMWSYGVYEVNPPRKWICLAPGSSVLGQTGQWIGRCTSTTQDACNNTDLM